MANQWFKFYGGEYLSDPKIENLTGNERSCWLTLLCLASSSSKLGTIEFMTVEILLKKSGIEFDPYDTEEWDRCLGVLKKFQRMKMVDLSDDGTITILNWEKRQDHNLTTAERVAKHRAKNNQKIKCNENVTSDVTNVTLEENRIEENRIEENNNIYGEFKNVSLSKEEHNKLIEKIGEKNTNILIEELSSYMASKKKRYSSHYATLLNWARRKIQTAQEKTLKDRFIA